MQRPKDVQRALDSARYFGKVMDDATWLRDVLRYIIYLESRLYGSASED